MIKNGLMFWVMFGLIFGFAVQGQPTVLDFGDNATLAPGFYGYLYYNNYTAGRTMDHHGNKAASLDLSYNAGTLKPAYYGKVLNHTFMVMASLPFGTVSAKNGFGEKERSTGIGDLVLSPGLFLYENGDSGTYISFMENVSIPTGNWSEGRALRGGPNLGLHYWVLQHQLGFAQTLIKGKISFDMNASYYQRFKEPQFDARYGDSFEIEGILGVGLTEKLRAGVYVDYWTDVSDTKINGIKIDDSKRKFFGIGPSLSYGTDKWSVNFRFVPDVWSENGPKGYQTWLRFFYTF